MEMAMELLEDTHEFDVRWNPFLLRPDMPPNGRRKEPLVARAGGGNSRVNPRLHAAGLQVGIDFTGKCDRYPSTILAHVLLEFAYENGGSKVQDQLMGVLFKSYFTDGQYPDCETLTLLASTVGMDSKLVKTVLMDEARQNTARAKALAWSRAGVSGVPFFIINDTPAFSGAQDVNTFVKSFQECD